MSEPKIISHDELIGMLKRGTRFCSSHSPFKLSATEKHYWSMCFARLPSPPDMEVGETLPLAMSEMGNSREHYRLWLEDSPDVANYFRGLSGNDPTVYHATREMIFIRLDIARFTKFPLKLQPRVLAEIHELVYEDLVNPRLWRDSQPKMPDRVLHTGDGFILPYQMPSGDPEPWPLHVAKRIAHVLDNQNDLRIRVHFRISVTCGPVYITGDLKGMENYVGAPITETERLLQCLSAAEDDLVCFSDSIYRKYRDRLGGMKFFRQGSVADKHGEMHRLYILEYND